MHAIVVLFTIQLHEIQILHSVGVFFIIACTVVQLKYQIISYK